MSNERWNKTTTIINYTLATLALLAVFALAGLHF